MEVASMLADERAPRRRLRRFLWMLPRGYAARDIEIAHRTARWAAARPSRHEAALHLIEMLAGREPLRMPVLNRRSTSSDSESAPLALA